MGLNDTTGHLSLIDMYRKSTIERKIRTAQTCEDQATCYWKTNGQWNLRGNQQTSWDK